MDLIIFDEEFVTMLAFLHRILDWFKNVFWKEEMELALVGLQNSGKTTFVNVISVSHKTRLALFKAPDATQLIWLS